MFRMASAAVRRIIIARVGIIGPRVIGIAVGNSAIAIGIRRNIRKVVTRVVVVGGGVVIVVWIVSVWIVAVRIVVVWVVVRIIHRRAAVQIVISTVATRRVVRTIVCSIGALTVGVVGISWRPRIVFPLASCITL